MSREVEYIKEFSDWNLVRIRTPMDGSCLIHAICKSYNKLYRLGSINGMVLDRHDFVRRLRSSLAKLFPNYYNQSTSLKKFSKELNGALSFGKDENDFTLSRMIKILDSDQSLDYSFFEFISDIFEKDIYVINSDTMDFYNYGITYKSRPSIIILFLPKSQHFELVGKVNPDGYISTLFSPDNPLISLARNKY